MPPPVRLSHQLNVSAFTVPQGWEARQTTKLLGSGLLAAGAGPGLVAYTGLGTQMLDRLETDCVAALAGRGFDQVQLPHVMSDEDLRRGDEVGEQFGRKFIHLSDPLGGYHLISSPETLVARLARGLELSYKGLPVRLCYRTSIFRNMTETRSFITCREFRVVGAMTFHSQDTRSQDIQDEVSEAAAAFAEVAAAWGVPTAQIGKPDVNELGYLDAAEGDMRVDVGGRRRRALSLSVGYQYGRGGDFPATYRAADNHLSHPQVMTIALCTNRLLYSAFDATRDEHGFALTSASRPFDVAVLPRSQEDAGTAAELASRLTDRSLRVALDDRAGRRLAARAAFASYLGTPLSLVVHRDLGVLAPRGTVPDFGSASLLDDAMATVIADLSAPDGNRSKRM